MSNDKSRESFLHLASKRAAEDVAIYEPEDKEIRGLKEESEPEVEAVVEVEEELVPDENTAPDEPTEQIIEPSETNRKFSQMLKEKTGASRKYLGKKTRY